MHIFSLFVIPIPLTIVFCIIYIPACHWTLFTLCLVVCLFFLFSVCLYVISYVLSLFIAVLRTLTVLPCFICKLLRLRWDKSKYCARFRLYEGGRWSQERDLVAWYVAGGRRRRPCYALHQAFQVNNTNILSPERSNYAVNMVGLYDIGIICFELMNCN